MEPRLPQHKQLPPLNVSAEELCEALENLSNYEFKDKRYVSKLPSSSAQTIQTHMSMVFLLPNDVFKVKKHIDYGFADFTTLTKRFQACIAEVKLNQRLAPRVYFGVVPISMKRDSRKITVRCDDAWNPDKNNNVEYWYNEKYGEIIEWAVHMVRLPDDHTLYELMEKNLLSTDILAQLSTKVVDFHKNARRGPSIDAFGGEDVIRRNIEQNFDQTKDHIGVTVSQQVYERIVELTFRELAELRSLIETRVTNGYTCDSHGDLRLEHVYLMDSQSKQEFLIIDCIEFNEQFRYGDPISDAAFLMMDIWRKGRPDLARFFQQQYLLQSGQDTHENSKLFLFYAAYRAVVRAKVSGFRVFDANLSEEHRKKEVQRARCYWLVALSMLSCPQERPCMIMIGGLPASGKSNLARMLAADQNNIEWLRADSIRKEKFAQQLAEEKDRTSSNCFEKGLYTPEMTRRTYDEILLLCTNALRHGKRVMVDATFRDPAQRQLFMDTAKREGALFSLIICKCDREIIRGRMLARTHDISDATWEVYQEMEKKWVAPEPIAEYCTVNTEKEQELTLRLAKLFLRKIGLL